MAFKKIEKQNIADEVFDILKREILDGTFKIGDKLPSEGRLSEQLGVSKASVRVAIQRLVTLGLLETRVGNGSFVREFDANNYLNQMFEFFLSDNDIKEITEYRLATEMAITEIAVKKATEEDFGELEAGFLPERVERKNHSFGEISRCFLLLLCSLGLGLGLHRLCLRPFYGVGAYRPVGLQIAVGGRVINGAQKEGQLTFDDHGRQRAV